MVALVHKLDLHFGRIEKAANKGAYRNFGHAAASIRKDAIASIETSPESSPAGSPPHTRRRQLPNAIRYDADAEGAVIGPVFSVVGTAGEAHEIGGSYRGQIFPERPFMGPALNRNLDRFASGWAGSIGE